MATASLELLADSSQIRTATKDLDKLSASGAKAESAQKGIESTAKRANAAFAGIGRSAGQAGIQIQQFVGQVQGGQSAMLALSQQGADLGFVLGAPLAGAIVGIGASLAGFLLPNLLNSGSAAKELKEELEELAETQALTAEQIAFLTQQESKSIEERAKTIKSLQEEIEANEDLIAANNAQLESARKLTSLRKGQNVADTQAQLAKSTKEANEELVEQRAKLSLLVDQQQKSAATIDGLKLGQDRAAEKTKDLTQSLQTQIIALQGGAQAAEVYALTQKAIADGTESQLPKLIELVNQKYELKRAQEAAAESAKLEIEQQKNYESVLDQIIAKEKQRQAQAAAAEASRLSNLKNVASSTLGLTDLQALEQQYKTEQDLLKQAQAEGIASTVSYQDRLTQLQQEYADKRSQIIKNEAKSQSFLTDSQMTSIGLIGDAFGNMAAIAEKGGKDSFETYKAFATAQAITSGILATMGTLAQASLYFAPPIPQVLAGTVAALSAVNVAQIQSQTYSGARATGGQVLGGNSYLVGERGPELFTPNSSSNGRITPFNQLMNEAGRGGETTTNKTEVNVHVQGVYQTGEDLILANRDLIYKVVADAQRRQGKSF